MNETPKEKRDFFITYAAVTTLVYYGTYIFNGWFFSSFSIAPYVSLIYLPAAVRVLFALVLVASSDWHDIGNHAHHLHHARRVDGSLV